MKGTEKINMGTIQKATKITEIISCFQNEVGFSVIHEYSDVFIFDANLINSTYLDWLT